jgi:long-subunit fatty acid transport protein
MVMKRILVITGLVLLTSSLFAQYPEDALRFSQIYWQGTARSMAAGSAFAGLGADFLTASTNPGGMAMYRSNVLSVSPEVFSRTYNSIYVNNDGSSAPQTSANKTMFDFSNIGYVIAKPIGRGGKGWKFYQISFGINRLNNYNSEVNMEGFSENTSRIDVYLEQTFDMFDNGFGLDQINEYDPFYLGPAWETFLMDTVAVDDELILTSPVPAGGVLQNQQIRTKGSSNEFVASFSANFNDVLYVGATLGIPFLRYIRESVYSETDAENMSDTFNHWSVSEYLTTRGWGINFKLGAIVRPADWIRIGAAFHTPTYYFSMRDSWYTNTTSDVFALSLGSQYFGNVESITGDYNYRLTTPMRFIGSVAFVIKEIGFISAEYEYADYSSAKFGASDYGFDVENTSIGSIFQATHNLRFGTEWRISKLSLRAGYAYYPSAYSTSPETGEAYNDGSRRSFSGGIGYRWNDLALDFAYVRSTMKEDYYMYSYANPELDIYIQSDQVQNTIIDQNFVLTLRYFFRK